MRAHWKICIPCGQGHAIPAATAEIAFELASFFVDEGAHLVVETRRALAGRTVHERQPLVELALALDSPDGHDVVELRIPGHRSAGVGDEATRHALHADEAHVCRFRRAHELDFALYRQVVERVLEGLVEPRRNCFLGICDLVRRDADMADLALLLCGEHALIHAGAVTGLEDGVGIVELVYIEVIGPQVRKRGLEVSPEGVGCGGAGLRCYEDVLAAG